MPVWLFDPNIYDYALAGAIGTTAHRGPPKMAQDDVERVFQVWRDYRPNPARCRLSPPRRKLIRARLKVYTADELVVLIRYANEADTAEARFWRGQNDRKQEYMDLENLLRVTKLDGRLERALEWNDDNKPMESTDGLDLGPMGAWS